eukprot:TRINITY_DN910_c0_g1_i2.p2 TRINITY_DN910_c0_g1~~TRINITY_DN910_c0_g1_i2.p2  ORF type:complete len:86 (-),score=12.46 TRINITY_DN910_c0_g1_i2:302-559(-)
MVLPISMSQGWTCLLLRLPFPNLYQQLIRIAPKLTVTEKDGLYFKEDEDDAFDPPFIPEEFERSYVVDTSAPSGNVRKLPRSGVG